MIIMILTVLLTTITEWFLLGGVFALVGGGLLIGYFRKKLQEKELQQYEEDYKNNQQCAEKSKKERFNKLIETNTAFLKQLAEQTGIKKTIIRYTKQNKEMEMRGRVNNRPLRLFWNYDSSNTINGIPEPNAIQMQIQCTNKTGKWLTLEKGKIDSEMKKFDASDDWLNEDELNMAIDDDVKIQGHQDTIKESVSILSSLDRQMVQSIMKLIKKIPLSEITHTDLLYVHFETPFHKMKDAMAELTETINTCIPFADAIDGRADIKELNAETAILAKRVNCPHCETSYILGSENICPSCGSPYTEKILE